MTPRSRPAGRALRLGVAGIVLSFCVLGGLHLLAVAPFLPADEMPHTGYAVVVGRGELPTLDTPTPLLPKMPTHFRSRLQIYTANHPPLFYLLAAVPLRIGIGTGHPLVGLYLARALSLLFSALGIVAVAALARILLPDRPALAVSAAGLVALIPALEQTAALVHNDGLAFTTAAATLAMSALVLVRGPTPGRVAALSLLAAAAALSRATCLPVVGAAALAAAVSALIHLPPPARRRIGAALAGGAAVSLTAFAAAGWFYLRNLRLYGDFTGVSRGREIFHQHPRGTLSHYLTGNLLVRIHDQLWGRTAGAQELTRGRDAIPYRVITLVILAGVMVAVVAALIRRLRGTAGGDEPAGGDGPGADRGRLVAWLLALAFAGVLLVSLVDFFADGGGLHARYLYPGLPGLAALGAAGLAALPGGRRGLPAIAVLTAHLVLAITLWARWVERTDRSPAGLATEIGRALGRGGVPAKPVMVAAGALLVAGFLVSVWSIWRLSGDRTAATKAPATPAPAGPEPPLPRQHPQPSHAATD